MLKYICHSKSLQALTLLLPLVVACSSAPKPPMPSGSRVPLNTFQSNKVEHAKVQAEKSQIENLRLEIKDLQMQIQQLKEEIENADALRLSAGALSCQGSGIAPPGVIESKPLEEKVTSKKDYTPRQAHVIESLQEHIATLVRS